MSAEMHYVLHYDEDTVAALLAALHICPPEKRLDSLATLVRIFSEDHPYVAARSVSGNPKEPHNGE